MRIFYLSLVVLLLIVLFAPMPVQAQSGPAPVLAYYYAWWAPQVVGPGKSPDWPVTPYHSWDQAVIQQHVAQAASAGINGLVVAWYGPQEQNNQTETNFRMILDQASANGITALLSIDLGSADWFKSTQEIVDGLKYALSVHAAHPAYFRYNGKPVLFFWYQGRYSLADWAAIRQQVDPNHTSIWIAEGAALDALPTFDGLHLYTISWADNPAGTLSQWGNSTRGRGGLWVATAMPGWDNTYTQQSEKYTRDRQDGAFYRETFAGAAASAPNLILITSWNEWWEGTQIEPSNNFGDFYLNLTRDLITEYQGSGAVSGSGSVASIQPAQQAAAPQPQTAASTSVPPAASAAPATETALPLPPTITPTRQASPTIAPSATLPITATSTIVAGAEQETSLAGEPAPEVHPDQTQGSLSSEDRMIIVFGGSAGVIGIGLILAVAAAYRSQ
jgi:hypothetical protein